MKEKWHIAKERLRNRDRKREIKHLRYLMIIKKKKKKQLFHYILLLKRWRKNC